eukprot:TRINITY_DN6047_c0_g2_i9.p1 TRINITY_DN6047_c0_g2~~TRINITY_DN6047_c0_g2_i9.p1  ORF type:complete len:279 (-),score=26.34 TRINITY_DN6047_c0_g2_i9:248-1084(-)
MSFCFNLKIEYVEKNTMVIFEKYNGFSGYFLFKIVSKHGLRANYATWESAVQGFGSYKNLKRIRNKAKEEGQIIPLKVPGPKPAKQPQAKYDERVKAWVFPFPGADAAVVRRSEMYFMSKGKPAVHYIANVAVASTFFAFILAIFGMLFNLLAQFNWGRSLLLRQPGFFSWGVFSKEGPSELQLQNTRFEKTIIASGYANGESIEASQKPDKQVIVKVSGPEMGYVTTPIVIVQAALTLLEEREKLPEFGVFTPASLLSETSYLSRLQENGITFEVIM